MQCTIDFDFKCEDLEQINHVQLYLNVLRFSAITSTDGNSLKKRETMSTSAYCLQSNYYQGTQQKPPKYSWIKWFKLPIIFEK